MICGKISEPLVWGAGLLAAGTAENMMGTEPRKIGANKNMDYKQLKSSVKEIADIAAGVPEPFQNKCFEVLLSALLAEHQASSPGSSEKDEAQNDGHPETPTPIPMTAQLRVLMGKTHVTEEELGKLILVTEGEVHFMKEPQAKTVRQGQIEWSLLLALKNAILKNSLTADPEEVRSKCQDAGFYDAGNFAANFKAEKAAKLFKGTVVPQGQPVALSPDGQDELGRLIKRLAS